MFSAMRRRMHVTPAGVVSMVALILAMSGGAYAASRYAITSTSQISPKVLKALMGKPGKPGKAGTAGAQGAAGAQGPAGPAGAQGPVGTNGEKGTSGETGAPGERGPKGATGSPWTAGGTLPSEATETGAWSMNTGNAGNVTIFSGGGERAAISFTIPLEAPLNNEHIQSNPVGFPAGASDEETERCPGDVEEPKATIGYLCVYTGASVEMGFVTPFIFPLSHGVVSLSDLGATGTSTSGALLVDSAAEEEGKTKGSYANGSWAVTAE